MYQKEYDKAEEYVKTAIECIKDYQNMMRCENNIKRFVRDEAWKCLQDMIWGYEVQIELLGALIGRKMIIRNLDPQNFSDDNIKEQLLFLQRYIPIFVLMRKGEETLAKKICEWLSGNNGEGR